MGSVHHASRLADVPLRGTPCETGQMSSINSILPFALVVFALMIIVSLYLAVGPRWRLYPSIPFTIGIGLLAAALAGDLYIDKSQSSALHAAETAQQHDTQMAGVLKELAAGQHNQIKVLELFVMPLAVSLIASAFFARADRVFAQAVNAYEEKRHELLETETRIRELQESLETSIEQDKRGPQLVSDFQRMKELQRAACEVSADLLMDHSYLIHSKAVPNPFKPKT